MSSNRRAEVRMSPAEVAGFLAEQRHATMCTMHPDGSIHAVAMWYGLLEGTLAIETRLKSQKMRNLERDPRVTFLVEAGATYDELRGVQIAGEARIIDDPDAVFRLGVSIWERYHAPYRPEDEDRIHAMMAKRVVVVPAVHKIVSWDHRKLARAGVGSA
jgi:PPOX class probable F420-dependent enzyme